VSNNDRAAELFTLLRASTSEMLGFSTPTPVQQLKVDLAAWLRMEIDRIVSQQLAGHPADVRALTGLTESLRSLFPAAADSGYDFSGARAELEAFLTKRAAAIERREVRESERLRVKVAELTEENALLRAGADKVRHNTESAAVYDPQPQSNNNVVPLKDAELVRLGSRTIEPRSADDRAKSERAWRDHAYGGGVIVPCWSPPGDTDRRR
jgi:hypothetical protein